MTVYQLLRSMPCIELEEWKIRYEREQFGERREDLRFGVVASTIVNSNPYRKKGAKPTTPEDFVVKFKTKYETVSDAKKRAMQNKVNALALFGKMGMVISDKQPTSFPLEEILASPDPKRFMNGG